MSQLGRMLVMAGLFLLGLGLVLMVGSKLGLGRLPGDMLWKRKGSTVYFPLATSLVVSIVLTVLLNLFIGRK